MIEAPEIELIGETATEWRAEGPLAHRVMEVVDRLRGGQGIDDPEKLALRPVHFLVGSPPPEHVGLGVGTQLSLAVVRLAIELAGLPEPPVETMARWSRRGRRSGVGLHGFFQGGLIVDGGRGEDSAFPPLVARAAFPADWSILVVRPSGPLGRHGTAEIQAFAELPPFPQSLTERLCGLVVLTILPAVAERDLAAFGAGVSEIQAHVGSVFSAVQGGRYGGAQAAEIIAAMTSMRLVGAGQSSWGPTLYAFGVVSAEEQAGINAQLDERFAIDASRITWTRAANRGAELRRLAADPFCGRWPSWSDHRSSPSE